MSIVEKEPSGLIVLDANAVTEITAISTKVAEIRERFALLEIEGPEDKAGFKRVHDARMEARDLRLSAQDRHKTAKAAVLEFGRKLDAAKNQIVGMIEPIEADLQKKEDGYNEAREVIKRKVAEEAAAKLQARVNALTAVGGAVSLAVLQALTDEQFSAELATATKAHEERKAAEEAARVERERQEAEARKQREAEDARIAAERAKLEAERRQQEELARVEREKLEAERRKQEEALAEERRKADEAAAAERAKQAEFARKLEEERRKVAEERQRIEREEFERQAKAKAEQEAREKLEAERKEQVRIEAERKAEEARREAMKPDIQKLRDYAAALESVPIPQVADAEAREMLLDHVTEVKRVAGQLEKWCDEQEVGA